MLKDKFLIGAMIGILADGVKLASNYAMFRFGWTNVVFWQIVAARFLEKNNLFKPSALFIGAVADITISAGLGVFFVYFISLFGRKYLFMKGIGYGLSIWVILFGTLLGQSVASEITPTNLSIIVTLIAHFVFGLSIAIFTKFIDKEQVTNEQFPKKALLLRSYLPQPVSKPVKPEGKKVIKPKKLIK